MPKKSVSKKKEAPKLFLWRRVGKWLCLSLAGAIFISASFFFYVSFSLLDSDRFTEMTGPLIQKPAIQKAIAVDMTNTLFDQVDVEKIMADSLPPKISFLAPAVYGQVKNYTESTIEALLRNEKFQTVWNDTLRRSHDGLVGSIREYKGDGTININDIYKSLQKNITDPRLGFIKGIELPSSIGNVAILQASWLPVTHNIVVGIYAYRTAAIILMLLLVAIAIWLSLNRRRAIIQAGVMLAILSLAMLVAIRLARMTLMPNVEAANLDAANEVWNAIVSPFAWQLVGYMAASLLIVTFAWIGGDTKRALVVRKKFDQLLAGKLHKALFTKENKVTIWVGKNGKLLNALAGLGSVISLLIININLANILYVAIGFLIAVAIVKALSASNAKKKK